MNKQIKLGKLEIAKRQLETAIILYFNDRDPISIHTLVCASHEIIEQLNKKAGGVSLILEGKIIKKEYQAKFRKMIREAKNFFKHADKDSCNTIDFNPETNDFYLISACEGYQILTGEKNPYFLIYKGWFHGKYPQVLNNQYANEWINNNCNNDKLKYFKRMLSFFVELA